MPSGNKKNKEKVLYLRHFFNLYDCFEYKLSTKIINHCRIAKYLYTVVD